MANTAQRLARQGRDLALKAASKGLRAARAGAEHALERASAARHGSGRPGDASAPGERAPAQSSFRGTAAPTAAQAVQAERAQPPAWTPVEPSAPPPDPTLEHVTEEASLAGESSDSGAERGAGPEVTVAPPWPGYEDMRARDIAERLGTGDAGLAAAVRLYEAANKGRKTVLDAAQRAERG